MICVWLLMSPATFFSLSLYSTPNRCATDPDRLGRAARLGVSIQHHRLIMNIRYSGVCVCLAERHRYRVATLRGLV